MIKDGHARWFEKRDELGNFVKRDYFDLEGNVFRTVGPKEVMNQKGVVISMVSPDSIAAQKGIQRGDVLLELADWKFFPQRELKKNKKKLSKTIEQTDNKSKRAVLFRPGTSQVIQFDLELGPSGLRPLDHVWPGDDLKEIQQAYEKFVKDRKTVGEKSE